MKEIMNSRALMQVALLVFLPAVADRRVLAQPPTNSIGNFRAIDVSSVELRVTVDYTYSGELGTTAALIHATPEEAGGVFDPRSVDSENLPLRVGAHTAVFVIRKRSAHGSFTSINVRVCMSKSGRGFLCKAFPHKKTWAAAPPSPTCLVSGRLSGRLVWVVRDPKGQPLRFRLTNVLLRTNGLQPIRVRVTSGGYISRDVPAGRTYQVIPANFRAEPRERTIVCGPNTRHTGLDFKITGPPPID